MSLFRQSLPIRSDRGVSDHQLIYCTRKVSHSKTNGHKQIKMRSLKYYTIDAFHLLLSNAIFPNYGHFPDVNAAYSDLIYKKKKLFFKEKLNENIGKPK